MSSVHNILKLNGQIMQFDNPNKRYEEKILWENDEAGAFNNLNVTLSDGNYKKLKWYYYINTLAPDEVLCVESLKEFGTRLFTPSSNGGVYYRKVTKNSDTNYVVGGLNPSTVTTTLLVPFKVVGIYS